MFFCRLILKNTKVLSKKRKRIIEVLKSDSSSIGEKITVMGWVRTKRGNKNINFIALNDGSTIHNIQIVVEVANFKEDILKDISTGASLSVTGKLVQSQGQEQSVEIIAETMCSGLASLELAPSPKLQLH